MDHPGLSKKLLYDDMRQRCCRRRPATGSLVALPAYTAASRRLSLEKLCRCAPPSCFLKMASASLGRSPQSRLHSDLASRSAVSQGSFHHRSGRGGGGRSRHHPAGEAVSGEERVPTCQLESVGSRCGPPAD